MMTRVDELMASGFKWEAMKLAEELVKEEGCRILPIRYDWQCRNEYMEGGTIIDLHLFAPSLTEQVGEWAERLAKEGNLLFEESEPLVAFNEWVRTLEVGVEYSSLGWIALYSWSDDHQEEEEE